MLSLLLVASSNYYFASSIALYAQLISNTGLYAGLVTAAFYVSSVGMRLVNGVLVQKYGSHRLMFLSAAVCAVACFAHRYAVTIALVVIFRLLHGAAYSMFNTASGTAASFLVPRSRLTEGIGYFAIGNVLALAFGLHRPGRRWAAALAVAALALAIREHALPFVLLMGAMALWRRDWREGAAWGALALAFVGGLAVHLHFVAQQVLPSDAEGPDWLVLRGLSGWLSSVILSSNLRLLPHFVAGPLMVLMLLGWAGWKSAAGAFATLLQLGYGLAFMLAGRPDNYYWGAMVAPTLAMGLAWAPMALRGLATAAR